MLIVNTEWIRTEICVDVLYLTTAYHFSKYFNHTISINSNYVHYTKLISTQHYVLRGEQTSKWTGHVSNCWTIKFIVRFRCDWSIAGRPGTCMSISYSAVNIAEVRVGWIAEYVICLKVLLNSANFTWDITESHITRAVKECERLNLKSYGSR